MGKYKSISTGLGGEIKLREGVVTVNDVPYGRFCDDGRHISPYKYGNPTLLVDDLNYVSGAYDGKVYGKLGFSGDKVTGIELTAEGEALFNGTAQRQAVTPDSIRSDDSFAIIIEREYNKATNRERTKGYANSFGTPVKIIAFIIIVLVIAIVFITDPPK